MLGLLSLALGLEVGCGAASKDPVATAGSGQSSAGAGDLGGSSAAGSSFGASAGEPTAGGDPSRAGASVGGSGATGGASSGEGGKAGLVDCDARKITCKRAAPACDTFNVPSVEGSCYGDCVKIDRCACSDADQCPDSNQYTCWSKTHCGPYVH